MASSNMSLTDTARILNVSKREKDGTNRNIYLSNEIFKPIDRITLAIIANGPITQQALQSLFNIFWSVKTLKDSLDRLENRNYIYKKTINKQVVWYYGISLVRQLGNYDNSVKLKRPDINASNFTEINICSRLFVDFFYRTLAEHAREHISKERIIKTAYIYKYLAPRFCEGTNKEKRRVIQNWGFDQNTYDKIFNTRRFKYGDSITNTFINGALQHWIDTEEYTSFRDNVMQNITEPDTASMLLKWVYTDRQEQMNIFIRALIIDAMSYCLRNWNNAFYRKHMDKSEKIKTLYNYDNTRRRIIKYNALLYCMCNREATEEERKIQEIVEKCKESIEKTKPYISYIDSFNNVRPFSLDTLREGKINVKNIDYTNNMVEIDILECSNSGFTLCSLYDKLALALSFCSYIGDGQYNYTANITIYTTSEERVKYLTNSINKVMNTDRSDKRPRLNTMINNDGKEPVIRAALPPMLPNSGGDESV